MIILQKQLLYNYKVSGAFFFYKIFTDFFILLKEVATLLLGERVAHKNVVK